MWPLKAHYLLWFGSLSGVQPYVQIFARQHLQISSDSVGILFFILPFINSIVKPLVCLLADHLNKHSFTLLTAQICMLIGYGLMLSIPFISQSVISLNALWWMFCLLTLLAHTANGIGVSLTDFLVVNEVVRAKQQGDEKANYGYYRIWGTIGFGIFGSLSGVINDKSQHLPYLIPGLVMFIGIELIDIICVCLFYHRKQSNQSSRSQSSMAMESVHTLRNENTSMTYNNQQPSNQQFSGWMEAIRTNSVTTIFSEVFQIFIHYPTLIQLCFIIFCFGILTSFHWSFFFWYLEELRGQDTLLMGLCILVESFLGEIPIFFIAHRIISALGVITSLCVALGAFALRYICYGYILIEDLNGGRYWDILLVEILQGLTFSLFYTVMTHVAQYYADKCERIAIKSGDGTESKLKIKPSATMQGLMSGCYEGIGLGTGSLIGGFVTKKYGVKAIWRVGAFLSIGLILFNLCIEVIKKIKRRS